MPAGDGGVPAGDGGVPAGNGGVPADRSFVLLEGCVMRALFAHVHAATRRSLERAGYREIEAQGQGCCGALHAHAGDLDAARHMARRNIAAFESAGQAFVATNAAGCGQAMRQYPEWLDEPEWRARAEGLAERVRDVTVLLAASDPPAGGRLAGRAAYDAPCHLIHGQRVREAPLKLLDGIEDLELVPLRTSEVCCGGAGVYNLVEPELSELVLASKLDEVEAADVEWVATGNPGCIMQIGAGLAARGSATRVVHPIELLDRAAD